MKGLEIKIQFIRRIQSSRRQLERTIFYFHRSPSGALQVSGKTRYSEEEMRAPGVYGSWSMLELINNVCACEQSFLYSCKSPAGAGGGSSLMLVDHRQTAPYPPLTASELPLEEALRRFQESYQEVLEWIRNLPVKTLFPTDQAHPGGRRTLAEEAAEATYRSYDRARESIRQWQKARLGRLRVP